MLNIVKNTAAKMDKENTINEIDQYELKSFEDEGNKTLVQKVNDEMRLEEAKLIDFGSGINIFDDERCSKIDLPSENSLIKKSCSSMTQSVSSSKKRDYGKNTLVQPFNIAE